jgi:hypothetical protein
MVNLSTVYGVSIVLGSLAAMGAAYVGTKVYPIQTGGDPLAGATALAATITGAFAVAKKAVEPKPEPLATETVTMDQLKDALARKYKLFYPNLSDDVIDQFADATYLTIKKMRKEKPLSNMNSYELENFKNELVEEVNKKNIEGSESVDAADVAMSVLKDENINQEPPVEESPPVEQPVPEENTSLSTS